MLWGSAIEQENEDGTPGPNLNRILRARQMIMGREAVPLELYLQEVGVSSLHLATAVQC